MSGNEKAPPPFQAPAGTPLLGQPFTPLAVGIPMVMSGTCNCGAVEDRATLTMHPLAALVQLLVEKDLLSAEEAARALVVSATCPHCRKIYSVFFNPQNGQTQMNVTMPTPDAVIS